MRLIICLVTTFLDILVVFEIKYACGEQFVFVNLLRNEKQLAPVLVKIRSFFFVVGKEASIRKNVFKAILQDVLLVHY